MSSTNENQTKQYLISIYRPMDYDPTTEDSTMRSAIDALNDEMNAANIVVFVGGLTPHGMARSLRVLQDGKVRCTEGLCLRANAHVGGLWVVRAKGMEEAIEWGGKAAQACRAEVEVRAFL